MTVFLLSEALRFPPPEQAEQDGLLAVGGDLRPDRLLLAYRMGIFPWFSERDPILWWSPDPRLVLYPSQIHVSRRLRRIIKQAPFTITMDTAFDQVIGDCAATRTQRGESTWIVDEMIDAYVRLHHMGYAHSVEAWHGRHLAGALYGVSLGGSFFGESMVTHISNASSLALVALARFLQGHRFDLIDCQVATGHLMRFGARPIPRRVFLGQLQASLVKPDLRGRWSPNGHFQMI